MGWEQNRFEAAIRMAQFMVRQHTPAKELAYQDQLTREYNLGQLERDHMMALAERLSIAQE